MNDKAKIKIERDSSIAPYCFGCGKDNPIGAKLEFFKTSDMSLETEYIPPKEWGGWNDIVHGGLQTVLLDEVAGWAVIALLEEYAFTIKAEVKFYKPVYIGNHLKAIAVIDKVEGKNVILNTELRNSKGEICTKGEFIYRMVEKKKALELSHHQE